MEKSESVLSVFFEEPFWIGIYERRHGKTYEVCKIVFGAEPKDFEVFDFVLKKTGSLRFSKGEAEALKARENINPKRMQREIKKQLQNTTIGTKAQQTISRQREENKLERKTVSKQMREAEKERRLALHREKQRQKHNGH